MAIVKVKPTRPAAAPWSRWSPHLHKGAGSPLLEPQKQNSGRNNNGHITMRHKGGGHKHHYRVVDFKRNKDGIPAKVERIEYDPNRTATSRWCATPMASAATSSPRAPLEVGADGRCPAPKADQGGNTLPIRNIPVGSIIHCIEMLPARARRSRVRRGTSATLLARRHLRQVRLRSGEVRKIHIDCRATIGEGEQRRAQPAPVRQGRRDPLEGHPPDRSAASPMNPVDHPHGGGEGRTGEGQSSGVPWNTLTKGYRTRNNKRTQA